MSYNLGLNIVETDGRATPGIIAAPTSVTGFIIQSQRGIAGTILQITNWSQFVENFGSYVGGAYGAYAVRGFFDNGGTMAYVTRVVNTIDDSTAPPPVTSKSGPWKLNPNSKLTFTANHFTPPVEVTFQANSAELLGKAGPFDLSGDKQIIFTINGTDSAPYTFKTTAAVTVQDLVNTLNSSFQGMILASVKGTQLSVQTLLKGTTASLAAKGTAASVLFDNPNPVKGGGNVGNIDQVTSVEAKTLLQPVLAGKLEVTEAASQITIKHPIKGSASTLQIGGDAASIFGFNTALQRGTASNAVTAARTNFSGIDIIAGYCGKEDPGAWGNKLSVTFIKKDGNLFDLVVKQKNNGNDEEKERWENLNTDKKLPDFVATKINDEFSGSKYIYVKVPDPLQLTWDAGVTEKVLGLQGGTNDTFRDPSSLSAACKAACNLFDLTDIQLLICPETQTPDFINGALTHCENKGDRMFIGQTPDNVDATGAKQLKLQRNKAYGALYFPWIRVLDPLTGKPKWVPPSGHVAGVYARTERERGIWKAPAGNAANINGALDVKYAINDIVHTDLVKNGSINAIRFIPGQGIVIDSSRTLSTNPLWYYVNARLLFNYVKSSLKNSLRWVVQEPNDQALWNKIKYNSVTPFLMGLWRRGAFGSGPPEKTFTVKIDGENNPSANIQQGILTLEVYFYPSRPAETIVIVIGQQEAAASASES